MNITLLTTQTTVASAVGVITTPADGKQQSVMRVGATTQTAFVSTFFRPDTENENWAFECVDAQFVSTSIVSGDVSGDVRFYAESPQTMFTPTFFRPDTENENWAFECVDAQFVSTSIVSGDVSGDVRFYAESPQNVTVTTYKQKSWKDQLTLGSSETTAPIIEFWS